MGEGVANGLGQEPETKDWSKQLLESCDLGLRLGREKLQARLSWKPPW